MRAEDASLPAAAAVNGQARGFADPHLIAPSGSKLGETVDAVMDDVKTVRIAPQ
jgi:hypothetical protein